MNRANLSALKADASSERSGAPKSPVRGFKRGFARAPIDCQARHLRRPRADKRVSGQANASVAASVYGSTSFTFPTVTVGTISRANADQIDYVNTPSWNGNGGIGSHTGVSASARFNYDLGPSSGSKSLYDAALNASSSATITGGTSLTGSFGSSGTVVGPTVGLGYGLSALFASASVGLHGGLNIANSVVATPTVEYGYYS